MITRWRRLAVSAVRSTVDRAHGSLHRLREERWPFSPRALREALAAVRDVEGSLERDELTAAYEAARDIRGDCVELGPCDAQVTCLIGTLVSPYKLYVIWPKEAADPAHPLAERYVRWHRHVLRKQLVPQIVPVLREGADFVPSLPSKIDLLVTHGLASELTATRRLDLGAER